jgi:hypothetical protein
MGYYAVDDMRVFTWLAWQAGKLIMKEEGEKSKNSAQW